MNIYITEGINQPSKTGTTSTRRKPLTLSKWLEFYNADSFYSTPPGTRLSLVLNEDDFGYKTTNKNRLQVSVSCDIQFNELNGILNLQDDAMISISEARKIEAQRLEIALSDDGNVTTINAKGDVKLTEEAGRIAYSGSAFYEAENGNMTLSDSVEILDGNNQLRGDKAIINMETGYSKILAGSEDKRVTGKLILGTSN